MKLTVLLLYPLFNSSLTKNKTEWREYSSVKSTLLIQLDILSLSLHMVLGITNYFHRARDVNGSVRTRLHTLQSTGAENCTLQA